VTGGPPARRGQRRTIALVGGTAGIGRSAALRLAAAGHRLIVVGRDRRAGEALKAEMGDGHAFIAGDISTLAGVEQVAAAIGAHTAVVDTLMNNAGVMEPVRRVTGEGFEVQFAVHHLAPWSTTSLLLPLLMRGDGRVINTNSEGHRSALFSPGPVEIDFADLQSEDHYDMFVVYSRAKLANLLFTYELQRRVPSVTAVAVHPGMVRSKLTRSFRSPAHRVLAAASRTMLSPPEHGAAPLVQLATAEHVEGGTYYDGFKPVGSSPQSHSMENARRLWEETERLRGPF
jgi:retinol dehydrogenase 12